MADAIAAVWSDPLLTPPTTVEGLDCIRCVFIKGNDPMFIIDVPPGVQRVSFPMKFVDDDWVLKVCPMKGGKYSTATDTIAIPTGEYEAGEFEFTPTDQNIPPIEDLAPEFEA
jgi:hypothetical protein